MAGKEGAKGKFESFPGRLLLPTGLLCSKVTRILNKGV
jgi:hypothetical protein